MSITLRPELLTEAAGVKIFRTPLLEEPIDPSIAGKICVTLENVKETKLNGKTYGFHLTKSKWDPYPWVSYVETESAAGAAGLRAGDCLMCVNEKDAIGLKIKEIAALIHHHQEQNIKLLVWRYSNVEEEEQKEAGVAIKGPLPDVASKLANALSGVVRALECPICLESSTPPVSQCVHGHIICVSCRPRTQRCPVCRIRLGQGRCLLADKLHKTFREVFDIKNSSPDNAEHQSLSLRDRLFGRSKRKSEISAMAKSNNVIPKARKLLLTKLFLGGVEKAASADNLTVAPNRTSSAHEEASMSNLNFDERLGLHDRTKSASTGELSKETTNNVSDRLQIGTPSQPTSSTTSLMSSVPLTPVWGGSMDSVSCVQITCPLSKQNGCKDIITPGAVVEHLSSVHEVPQVHFHSNHIKIPLPLPFGSEAAYVLHCGGDLFFLQCEQETVWITCATGGKNAWEWSLHGRGKNSTEIKIRRTVASLENPMILSSQHIAPLPNALLLHTLDIQLLEYRSREQINV